MKMEKAENIGILKEAVGMNEKMSRTIYRVRIVSLLLYVDNLYKICLIYKKCLTNAILCTFIVLTNCLFFIGFMSFIAFIQGLEAKLQQNSVKKIREQLLISKAELARKAGVSPLTIDRIEKGKDCRMETKRKIILALGYDLSKRKEIFHEA